VHPASVAASDRAEDEEYAKSIWSLLVQESC
jgi:hypothetical protein